MRVPSFLKSILNRARIEDEMSDELRFHLDERTDDLMRRRNLSYEEARRQARLEFGSIEKYKEEGRRARGYRLLDELRGDLGYALRQFRAAPTFTAVTVLTLAIGIGVNTAAFTRVNDALFKKLNVPAADELRQLQWASAKTGFRTGGNSMNSRTEGYETSFSYPAYAYMRDHSSTFSDLICLEFPRNLNVGKQGQAEVAESLAVSGNYFQGLGVEALLGRTIMPEDDREGSAHVAVLSYAYWQRVFGGDASVIGQSININTVPSTVVGVVPRQFSSAIPTWKPDIMVPMSMLDDVTSRRILNNHGYWSFLVVGRLKAGMTDEKAIAETQQLLHQSILESPTEAAFEPPRIALAPGATGFVTPDATMMIPMITAGLVLLIVCANIAGLHLSKATTRHREIGTRLSMGASRSRLLRQLLTESLILAGVGGAIGVALAFALTTDLPEPDSRVLAFSMAISLVSGILFGIAPALSATRVDLLAMLKQSVTSPLAGRSRFKTGKALVTVQVALSLVLMVGAGMLLQTVNNLKSQAMGFESDNLLTFRMNPYQNGYRAERLIDFYEEALSRTQSLPGVRFASMSRWGILTQSSSGERIQIPGRPAAGAATHYIASNYFETMGIPLLAGRAIDSRDRKGAPVVAVVSEAFAKRFFTGTNPIGKTFKMEDEGDVEIVGIVGDTKYSYIRSRPVSTVYLSYKQLNERWMTFAVRTTGDPSSLISPIRQTLARLDSNVPIYDVHTQKEWIDINVSRESGLAGTLSFYGLVAVLLAGIGVYGTLAFLVNRRTAEIGVRAALGARRSQLIGLVISESVVPVGVGVALGLGGSFLFADGMRAVLFRTAPDDPLTILGATSFIVVSALLAAYLPARRAARVDPMTALRYE